MSYSQAAMLFNTQNDQLNLRVHLVCEGISHTRHEMVVRLSTLHDRMMLTDLQCLPVLHSSNNSSASANNEKAM